MCRSLEKLAGERMLLGSHLLPGGLLNMLASVSETQSLILFQESAIGAIILINNVIT